MTKASEQAHALWPYLLPLVQRVAINGVNGLTVSGASGGGGAPSPHTMTSDHHTGPISNLQGPQFLLLDGARALTGHLSVNAGITIDGVDLSAHVADPDAHHNRVTVGAGLTLATQHVVVNQAYDFAWTGIHSFSLDPQLSANLDFVGADRSITGTGDITISPADDLFLDPTGDVWLSAGGVMFYEDDQEVRSIAFSDLVTGIQGFRWWERSDAVNYWQLTMGALRVDELYARVFVADEVRIDRGEEYWSKSFGIVETDFVMPALGATVDVWLEDAPALLGANLFTAGDWLLMRIVDWGTGLLIMKAWFQATSLQASDTVNDRQQWRLTYKKFGTAGVTVKKGSVMLCAGVVGQGWLHLSALSQGGGPFFQVGDFTSIIADEPQFTNRVRMGNLDGTVDYSSGDVWGFAAGNNLGIGPDAGFSGLTADATTGLRLFNSDIYLYTGSDLALSIKRAEGIRIKGQPAAFAALYSYEFRNTADVELGGVYLRYTDSGTDTNEISLRALGSAGVRPYASLLSDSAVASSPAGDPLVLIQANNTNSGTIANITMDVTPTAGTIVFGATNYVQTNPEFRTNYVRPQGDNTHDIGSASFRYRAIYADQVVVSGAISGASIGGQTWTYPGNMIIDAVSGSNTTLSLTNSGAGRADLDVDRNITVGGTVDGVDISVHAVNANAHHDQATAGDGIAVTVQSIAVNSTVVRTTLSLSAGAGLTGGGDLSANRTFTVGAGDGISVAADAVAVDSTVARTTIDMIAGAGLTGGGTLAASRTFAVGAGAGIAVAADSVAVSLAGTSGLNLSSGLAVDDSIAGAGLTITSKVLNVIAADGSITVGANNLNVNLAHAFAWTATHTFTDDVTFNDPVIINDNGTFNTGVFTFNTAPQVNANFHFLGAARFITAADSITIAPATDLALAPSGKIYVPDATEMRSSTISDLVTGIAGFRLWDRGSNYHQLTTGAMKVDELYAKVFVSDEVRIDRAEWYLSKSFGIVETDFILPADEATVNVWFENAVSGSGNLFTVGDWLMLRVVDWTVSIVSVKVWFTVTALVTAGTVDGYKQQWTIKREDGGTTGQLIKKGARLLDSGVVGQGWIHASALSAGGGPFIQVGDFTSVVASDTPVFTNRVRMGNLDGVAGLSGTYWGFAAGNNLALTPATGFSGFTAEATNGLRLFNTRLEWIDSGADSFTMAVNPSSTGIRIAEGGAMLMDLKASTVTFSGGATFESNVQITAGALIVGSGGVDFSADAGGGSVLDKYIEGTWTPVITASGGGWNGTYAVQVGTYTRIGNVVFYNIYLNLGSTVTSYGTGDFRISLPITATSTSPAPFLAYGGDNSGTPTHLVFVTQGAYGSVYGNYNAGAWVAQPSTYIGPFETIIIQGSYFV